MTAKWKRWREKRRERLVVEWGFPKYVILKPEFNHYDIVTNPSGIPLTKIPGMSEFIKKGGV